VMFGKEAHVSSEGIVAFAVENSKANERKGESFSLRYLCVLRVSAVAECAPDFYRRDAQTQRKRREFLRRGSATQR